MTMTIRLAAAVVTAILALMSRNNNNNKNYDDGQSAAARVLNDPPPHCFHDGGRAMAAGEPSRCEEIPIDQRWWCGFRNRNNRQLRLVVAAELDAGVARLLSSPAALVTKQSPLVQCLFTVPYVQEARRDGATATSHEQARGDQ
jgi:hypothetical protein